ncbi:hypothetical protein [Tautonia sociabilis]|uniref:Glycosyltransferase RgtA/B/C/D-like domain-containing protein n=1 Tax=Tautonia sociabilis TaxID=2080755 RepID=A0A432MFU8_9BACT|nr:hypothetical protein [Tautonia sociabilis]RUL85053.1 hypothetical protein TsocGM_19120 [Tautonia sociabilis]
MARSKLPAYLAIAAIVPLLGLAFWFRITSLNAPSPNGDESFYGVQTAKLLRGEPIASTTASGNPINVLVIGAEIPLYLALGPSNYVIKIPAAVAGILAVLASYVLWSRALDRTTAAIGAGLMAVLPVLIAESRIGAEPAWNPLVGVIALAAAFRGHRLGLALAFLLCYYVHSTYLFLLPTLGLVLLVKLFERTAGDPTARWRSLAITTWGALAVISPLVLLTSGRSAIQWTYDTYDFGPGNWPRFLLLFERLLMGFCEVGPTETSAAFDRTFWAAFGSILLFGSWCLHRQRRWDRLALIGGLILSLVGMHAVTGPDILRPYFVRYGLYLVTPTVLAVSCCLRAMLVPPEGGWATRARRLQVAGMIGLAWTLLASFMGNYIGLLNEAHAGQESYWTLRTEAIDPKQWAAKIVARDIRAARERGLSVPDRLVVLGEDWWTHRPLQFLLGDRDDIVTGSLEPFDGPGRDALIRRHLESGGYIVGTPGQDVMLRVEGLFPPEALKHWHVLVPPHASLAIYRLKRENEPPVPLPKVVLRPPGLDEKTAIR